MIYLDNGATSFPKPESVYVAMDDCMRNYCANPGRAGHKLALKAGREIHKTRGLICKLFNIENPMRVIFTSNATDSLNLGIKGFLRRGDHVITTSMEHNSVIRPIKALEKYGVRNTVVQCEKDGTLNIKNLKRAIRHNTKMIVMTHASNVTGTLMPIEEVGSIAKSRNIIFLVDAAQSAGIYDIDVQKMNIDMLAMPGHKGLLGPQGTGILYVREGLNIRHLKEGGTGSKSESLVQPDIAPDKYESGTNNTCGIVGLGAGIEFLLEEGLEKIRNHEKELTGYMIDELKKVNRVKIYGPADSNKQGAVISMNLEGLDCSDVGYILDRDFDIGVRTGLHCAPLAHKTIGTLEEGTVRLSIGYFNTKEDIDKAVDAIKKISEELNK
ncbi:aminotransferase class V-fold PLP-dependent enzyme [Anaeromicrobium sediminis]|uniref:cysteine desulfurase n=1 Tax=Anaeromicrobium sediminis TaxID=1478221 RepID=A0A267MFT5_9FIRM|nr:aminotransferase class V-fold PLP-dependent enzyme [Anaeromicrobium sediminis]PAB58444.1 cysteine desulfurase [Anaeromicrobium sediminis]